MNNLKSILLLSILLNQTISACSENCLKCDSEQNCILCDLTQFYIIKENACLKHTPDNCKQIDVDGNCLICEDGYFKQSSEKVVCIKLSTDKVVENCTGYSELQDCVSCKQKFYVLGKNCVAVSVDIEKCMIYETDSTCKQCEENTILSLDKKSCKTSPKQENCQKYSQVICQNCNVQYTLNENLYIKDNFLYSSNFEKQKSFNYLNKLDTSFNSKMNICEKMVVDNCKVLENFEKCQECKDNYYLDPNQKCIKNPIAGIKNCKVYTAEDFCIECLNRFMRIDAQNCDEATQIDYCQDYDGTSTTSSCKVCEQGFYLSKTQNNCVQRKIFVQNCKQYFFNDDLCEKCNVGYVLTDDKLLCLEIVENCTLYITTSKDTKQEDLQCQTCDIGYHINGKTCSKGTITNCYKYSAQSTYDNQICSECDNQYYLKDEQCYPISKIDHCKLYHKSQDKTCTQCEDSYYNFMLTSKCVLKTEISHCVNYSADFETCTECENYYHYNTITKECDSLSTEFPNCKTTNADKTACTECDIGYFIYENKCKEIFSSFKQYCDILKPSTFDSLAFGQECSQCSINSYPQKLDLICVENYIFQNQDCLVYKDTEKCLVCKDGKVINKTLTDLTQQCLTNCAANETLIRFNLDDSTQNYCIAETGNCEIQAPYLKLAEFPGQENEKRQICIKCKANFIPIADYQESTPINTDFSTMKLVNDLQDQFYKLSCEDKSTKQINSVANGALDSNCQYYTRQSPTNYVCTKCKPGYTSEVTVNPYGIGLCQLDDNFSTKQVNGLQSVMDIKISSYECVDTNKVPYYTYFGNSLLPCPLDFSNSNNNYQATSGKSIQCIKPSDIFAEDKIIQNCAIYSQDLSTPTTHCGHGTNIKCMGCKPGFKPTYTGTGILQVTSCNLIENCVGNDWFNSCSKCASDHLYLYDDNSNNKFRICQEKTTLKNCLIYKGDRCIVCEENYQLNESYKCDTILQPNCEGQQNIAFILNQQKLQQIPGMNVFYLKSYFYSSYLKMNKFFKTGCLLCKNGFKPIINPDVNAMVCLDHQIFKTDLISSLTEGFTKMNYCLNSQGDTLNKCAKCRNGKTLDIDGSCLNLVANCQKSNGNQCNTCNTAYANVDGECKEGKIDNCLEYFNNDQPTYKCKKCKNGFKINGDKCVQTANLNCISFETERKCLQCQEGYQLINIDTTSTYCLKIDDSLLCKQGTVTKNGNSFEFDCNECKTKYQKKVTFAAEPLLFDQRSICFKHDQNAECSESDLEPIISNTLFYCEKCRPDYYLNTTTRVCHKRENLPKNCEQFKIFSDKCEVCKEGSFLVNSQQECQSNPDGIPGCEQYTSKTVCKKCGLNTYIQNGVCNKIKTQVNNCFYYQNADTCSQCATNYYLEDNKCIKSELSNCIEFISIDSCKTCRTGYGIAIINEKNTCVQIKQPFCVEYETTGEFKCLICEQKFYPSEEGKCIASEENEIAKCIIQSAKDQCEKCEKNTVLSNDKKSCLTDQVYIDLIPFFCDHAQFKEDYVCSACQGGYFMKSGKCITCESNEGCYQCDINNENKCFFCKPGYFMQKDGACIQIKKEVVVEPTKKEFIWYLSSLLFLMFI